MGAGEATQHHQGLNKQSDIAWLPIQQGPWLLFASIENFLSLLDYIEYGQSQSQSQSQIANSDLGYYKVKIPKDAHIYQPDKYNDKIYAADQLELSEFTPLNKFPLFQDEEFIRQNPEYCRFTF
jgi:hypothetical protein